MIFWFLIGGLGIFLPLLVVSYVILRAENHMPQLNIWTDRLRFRKMSYIDWKWCAGSIVLIGFFMFIIMKLLEAVSGTVDTQPSFMTLDPLTPGRYWILLLWLPYWLLNIFGEEILWRGTILPRQEITFGKYAWFVHG